MKLFILDFFLCFLEMSIECTSNRRKKHQLSPTSCERTNEVRRLWYQRNKDAINYRRRSVYHSKKNGIHIADELPHSRKYRSLADIMQRTFPIVVSFLEYFPSQIVSPLIHPPSMNVFFHQLFPFPEDHPSKSKHTHDNFQPSSNADVCSEIGAKEEDMHLQVAQIIPEIEPSERNLHFQVSHLNPQIAPSEVIGDNSIPPVRIVSSFDHPPLQTNVVPPIESIIPLTISLGTTKVFP